MKNIKNCYTIRIATLVTFVFVGSIACYAQGGGRLAGTWDARVTIRNCQTGTAGPTFDSIANFNQGGTYLGSTSGRPQSSRTPEHGVWKHVRGNLYIFKFKSFNFDPMTGAPTSYGIVTHEVELDSSASEYTSRGGVVTYSMSGIPLSEGCSDAVGTRFTF
jgi:hypothetical protein